MDTYNFVLQHEMLNLGIVTLSSHIAAMTVKIPIVLFSGFLNCFKLKNKKQVVQIGTNDWENLKDAVEKACLHK
jgi:hypothetical protein